MFMIEACSTTDSSSTVCRRPREWSVASTEWWPARTQSFPGSAPDMIVYLVDFDMCHRV